MPSFEGHFGLKYMKLSGQSGFTLLELIVVIVILGIIAVSASSKFGSQEAFSIKVQQEDLISTLELAQQLALSGQVVTFNISAGMSYTVTTGGANYNVGGISYPRNFTGSITSITSSATLPLIYDRLGQTTPTVITITSANGDTETVRVEASGYAH